MFCLAYASQQTVPNRNEKEVFQRAGLGRLKNKFNAKGSPQTFKDGLESEFPGFGRPEGPENKRLTVASLSVSCEFLTIARGSGRRSTS